MGNIDKNRTVTAITTLTFSVLALTAIIYQHSSTEVLETAFENTRESDQVVIAPVNETVLELESGFESPGAAEIVTSFKSAFAAARKQDGPGKTFVYKSKEYSTSYAEELNNNDGNIVQDKEGNIIAEKILAETPGTINTGVFSHVDQPND